MGGVLGRGEAEPRARGRMIDVPDFSLGGRRGQVSERRHAPDEEEKKEQQERLPVLDGWVWM